MILLDLNQQYVMYYVKQVRSHARCITQFHISDMDNVYVENTNLIMPTKIQDSFIFVMKQKIYEWM